jgi:hypothetical protein
MKTNLSMAEKPIFEKMTDKCKTESVSKQQLLSKKRKICTWTMTCE